MYEQAKETQISHQNYDSPVTLKQKLSSDFLMSPIKKNNFNSQYAQNNTEGKKLNFDFNKIDDEKQNSSDFKATNFANLSTGIGKQQMLDELNQGIKILQERKQIETSEFKF